MVVPSFELSFMRTSDAAYREYVYERKHVMHGASSESTAPRRQANPPPYNSGRRPGEWRNNDYQRLLTKDPIRVCHDLWDF